MTRVMSLSAAVNALAASVGPLLANILIVLCAEIKTTDSTLELLINANAFPGWFMALL